MVYLTVPQFITNATYTLILYLEAASFFPSSWYDVQNNSLSFPSQDSFSHTLALHLPLPFCALQGEAACQQIHAEIYLECSAKCRENIENVFKEATTIALNALKKAKRQKNKRVCSVL